MKRREEKRRRQEGLATRGLPRAPDVIAGVRPVDEKKGRGQRKKSILGVEGVEGVEGLG